MRTIDVADITKHIKEMCIEANHFLSEDMDGAMKQALSSEKSPLGCQILTQLQENLQIAGEDMIPICQDTGMAVIFMEIGQDVHFEGGILEDPWQEFPEEIAVMTEPLSKAADTVSKHHSIFSMRSMVF